MDTENKAVEQTQSTSTTWLLIYTVGVLLIVHQMFKLTYFWRKGIQGPMPLPLLGNFLSFISGFLKPTSQWRQKYGKFYGMFFGGTPMINISDADVARQILIKEFSSFQAREVEGQFKIPYVSDSVASATGEKWKRGRSYMSPTFSGSKMKQMIPSLNDHCDILLSVLEDKKGDSFEIKEPFGHYVIDNVATCAFGFDADCQRSPDDQFLKYSKKIFEGGKGSLGTMLRMLFPFLGPVFDYLGVEILPKDAVDFFVSTVKQAMELRKEGDQSHRKDFLQLMMDAAVTNDEEAEGEGAKKKRIPLTSDELIGALVLFFFAGYETVSTTMCMMTYALAKYPDIQKRVQEEIDEISPDGKPVSYDAVFKMEYLDQVFCESARIWPMSPALNRICNKDFEYNGVKIANGEAVLINAFDIQHDEEYWSDPWKFNPENFSKEAKESRQPCAWLPFGSGPRNCVGMRFAILESKIAIIRILQKYTMVMDDKTPDLTDIDNLGKMSIYPDKGIHIRLVPRT